MTGLFVLKSHIIAGIDPLPSKARAAVSAFGYGIEKRNLRCFQFYAMNASVS